MKRGTKAPTSPILEALRDACHDEAKAVAFFEARRWGETPACPRCGDLSVYTMKNEKTGGRNKDFRWRCRGCKRMYSVRTGTVLEETRLPVRVWAFALWSACSSKKGVSALQISRECEINYKTALYLMHRIRQGMTDMRTDRPKLSGTVEVDETYVGGRPRAKGMRKRGRGTTKPCVVGIAQRGGDVRFQAVERLTSETLREAITSNVDRSSKLMTDELPTYRKIGELFEGGHYRTHHARKVYALPGGINSNSIEGAFSLLKRGLVGTFHSISRKHLPKYLAEFEFRYNTRKLDDGARIALAVKFAEGKRLTYAQQLAG